MSKASVLVVDDEAGIRESISDILSDEGYAVRVGGQRKLKRSQATVSRGRR